MGTFVTVGNAKQSFHRLLDRIEKIADLLPQPVLIQYGHTSFTSLKCRTVTFMEMDSFEAAIREADLIITHAGAGTLLQCRAAGKIPIVMPRRSEFGEHIDDHQIEFGLTIMAIGSACVVNNPDQLERLF